MKLFSRILEKIQYLSFQPEWARPPSTTPSGAAPVPSSTTTWRPVTQAPATTVTTTRRPSKTTTKRRVTTTTTTTESPYEPEEEVEEGNEETVEGGSVGQPDCSDGQDFLPHEDCSKYWRCVHGEAIEFQCKPGTAYHTETYVCDWIENADREECKDPNNYNDENSAAEVD